MASGDEDGGPAFPTEPNTQPGFYAHQGMALRDWFAGQALLGMLSSGDVSDDTRNAAIDAYQYADSMLDARK